MFTGLLQTYCKRKAFTRYEGTYTLKAPEAHVWACIATDSQKHHSPVRFLPGKTANVGSARKDGEPSCS
jgi:hypothetical protein